MRQKLPAYIAIVLLVWAGPACTIFRSKIPLTHHLTLQIDPTASDRAAATRETIEVIERRLDLMGVSNFEVTRRGSLTEGQILVNLPGGGDLERIKKMITSAGRLELVAVVSRPSPNAVQTFSTKEDALALLGGTIPSNRKVLPYLERYESTAQSTTPQVIERPRQWVMVEWPPVVDGTDLRNAAATQSMAGGPDYHIQFTLKPNGADKFGAWTAANINQYMGVVFNGEVKSIAFIKSQIFDSGEISGRFTKQSAEDLVHILNSGALPAPVKIVGEG